MNSSDCFVFCQNDLLSSSFSVFGDMREKEELTDFKFCFGNLNFTGHRLVLAAAVPYFRTIFANSQEEIILEEVDPSALKSVFDFAYCGKIKITSKNAQSLLVASKYLKLGQLNEACWEFLERNLCSENVWNLRVLAETYDNLQLMRTADHFIRENFEEFLETENFCAVPFLYLKETIGRDDVKVICEERIFEAVVRWVKAFPDERAHQLPQLLDLVRMPYLSPEFLIERVSREELIRNSILCRDLVDEAKLYHLVPAKRSEISQFITRPRICRKKPRFLTQEAAKVDNRGVYAICKSKRGLSVKLLDLKYMKWKNLSVYDSESMHMDAAISFKETIYLFAEEIVITFDVKKLTWKTVNTYQESLMRSGVGLHHNRIYFFGGTEDSSSKVRCFDLRDNKWLKDSCMKRRLGESGVASLSQFIYLTGGDYEGEVYESAERYDPVTKEWCEVSPMLSKRTGHGCSSWNGKIYVCGGFSHLVNDSFQALETTEVYDSETREWSFVSSSKEPLWRISFVPGDGKIYARETTQMFLCNTNPMQIYDPESDEWELCTPGDDPIFDGDCDALLVSAPVPARFEKTERQTEELVYEHKTEVPTHPMEKLHSLRKLGYDLYKQEKYKEACKMYEEVLLKLNKLRFLFRDKPNPELSKELEKLEITVLLNLSQCKFSENEYFSVLTYTAMVLERDADNVTALCRRAKACTILGYFKDAEELYKKALTLDYSLRSYVSQELVNLTWLKGAELTRRNREIFGKK